MGRLKSKLGRLKSKMGCENVEQKRKVEKKTNFVNAYPWHFWFQ